MAAWAEENLAVGICDVCLTAKAPDAHAHVQRSGTNQAIGAHIRPHESSAIYIVTAHFL